MKHLLPSRLALTTNASQIVEARDAKLRTSRFMAARPREILNFTGRGTSLELAHVTITA